MKHRYRKMLLSVFPPPQFLAMPSVGIDVSDNSLKFIELRQTKDGLRIGRFGEEEIPEGIVVGGKIQKGPALVDILTKVRKEHNMHFVRATLPEESGYLFELSLPDMASDEMTGAIEFRLEENVPIAPSEAVFGYDLLATSKKTKGGERMRRAVVSVFPRAATEAYAKLFYDAGLVPLSLETEPQAITRAVVANGDRGTYLVVDFGRQRSGISIVSGGAVRFATTTDVGGDPLTELFQKHFSDLAPEEIVKFKNTKGLRAVHDEHDSTFSHQIDSVIENLVEHIKEHLRYWNTRATEGKVRAMPVGKVLLCGGNANLAGLPERLSQTLRLPVARANVWVNVFSLERHIPSGIPFRESLGYAPAIGLALHGIHPVMRDKHMANLLPRMSLDEVRKERRRRMVAVSLSTFLVTVLFGTAFLVPSLVLSRTKATAAEQKVELTQTFIARREESGVLDNVREMREKIERLKSEISDISFSNVFLALDRSASAGIRLFSFSYQRSESGADSITLRGNAQTRDALLAFTRQLDHEVLFTEVVLPVSDLAQSTNINFSLTLSIPGDSVPASIGQTEPRVLSDEAS